MRTGSRFLAGFALAAALAAPVMAHADEAALPLGTEALRADMHRYFREEKRGGAVLMGMGAPAMALGGGLLAQDSQLLRGFAYPVLVIGALELVGGLIFYARTNRQVARLDKGLSTDPLATARTELTRMRRVNLQFTLIEALELTLLVSGVVMAAAGSATRNDTLTGVGLGLSLESAGLLVFDLFAGKRALRFTGSLTRYLQPAAAGP